MTERIALFYHDEMRRKRAPFIAYAHRAFLLQYDDDVEVMVLHDGSDKTPRSRDAGGDYNYPEMQAAYAASDQKFDSDVTCYAMLGGSSRGVCGRAPLGGNPPVLIVYDTCPTPERTLHHEDGHRLNRSHSGSIRQDAAGEWTDFDAYGGNGVMATTKWGVGQFNGADCDILGYIPATEIDGTREILLAPLLCWTLHPHEIRCARIKLSAAEYLYVYTFNGETVYVTTGFRNVPTLEYGRLEKEGDVVVIPDDNVIVEHMGSRNYSVKVSVTVDGQQPVAVDWPDSMLPTIGA